MSQYRYETRTARARRDARRSLITYVAVGLFLCLTLIGAPIGIVVIIVGLVQHSKSSRAISAAEHATFTRAQQRAEQDRIRIFRSFD